jgi:hypothetical protein
MDIDTYDDYDRYDNTVEDLTDEEAIEELVSEGYTEEEARRMLGEYDANDFADCDYYDDEPNDIPSDDVIQDIIDDEDSD